MQLDGDRHPDGCLHAAQDLDMPQFSLTTRKHRLAQRLVDIQLDGSCPRSL